MREQEEKGLWKKGVKLLKGFLMTPTDDYDDTVDEIYGSENRGQSIASTLYDSPRAPQVEEFTSGMDRYDDYSREENRAGMIQQDLGNGATLYSNTGKETFRYDLDFQLPVDFDAKELQDTMLEITERLKTRSDVIVDMGLLDDENALIVESFLIGACSTINYSVHIVRDSVLLLAPMENSVSDIVVIRRVTGPAPRKEYDGDEAGGYEYTNDYGSR
ncbi:MAG: hypothetical protein Q4A52_07660 [Bacillota bacterium]|nr:hypothetical protein [Bacillota bacterium]